MRNIVASHPLLYTVLAIFIIPLVFWVGDTLLDFRVYSESFVYLLFYDQNEEQWINRVIFITALLLISTVVLIVLYRFYNKKSIRDNDHSNKRDPIYSQDEKSNDHNPMINLKSILNAFDFPFYIIDCQSYEIKLTNQPLELKENNRTPKCFQQIHNRDSICSLGGQICPIEMVRKTKKSVIVEHIYQGEQGGTNYIEIHGFPILDERGRVHHIIEYFIDLSERKLFIEALARESSINSAVAELSQLLIKTPSLDTVTDLILSYSKYFSQSQFGFVGYIDQETGYLICPTMTKEIWHICEVSNKSPVFKEFKGLWGWVLNQKQSLFVNDLRSDPRSTGIPKGHIAIERFLGVPALVNDELTGMIGLANSPRDYTKEDLKIIERLAVLLGIAIQQKRNEVRLKKEHDQLLTIFNSTDNISYVIDKESFTLLYINSATKAIFGDVTGEYCYKAIRNQPSICSDCPTKKTLSDNPETDHPVHIFEYFDSTIQRWYKCINQEIIWTNGKWAYYEQAVDIDSLKRHEQDLIKMNNQLQQAIKEVEAANNLKVEFLNNVSHQLLTPLNTVLGFSQLLKNESKSSQTIEIAGSILESGIKLKAIVDDMLDMSKLERGRVSLKIEPVVLSDVVFIVEKTVLKQLSEKPLDLDVKIKEHVPSIIMVDKDKIIQILASLFSNAIKYTNQGKVALIIDCDHRYLYFAVEDTGIGINENSLTKIFDPFFQIDGSLTKMNEGTGLGLSITKRLIEVMGGNISVQSKLGKGSIFMFSIPLNLDLESIAD